MFISSLISTTFSLFLALNIGNISTSMNYGQDTTAGGMSVAKYQFTVSSADENTVNKNYYLTSYNSETDAYENLLLIKYTYTPVPSGKITMRVESLLETNLVYNFKFFNSQGNYFISNFDTMTDSDFGRSVDMPYVFNSPYVCVFNVTAYSQVVYDSFFNKDYQTGYNSGKETGYQEGYIDGMTDAGNGSYNEGFNAGKQVGFQEGSQSSTTFWSLFGAVADTPVMMIRRLFNFDLFGTSMVVVALSLLSFLILFKVIKKVIK